MHLQLRCCLHASSLCWLLHLHHTFCVALFSNTKAVLFARASQGNHCSLLSREGQGDETRGSLVRSNPEQSCEVGERKKKTGDSSGGHSLSPHCLLPDHGTKAASTLPVTSSYSASSCGQPISRPDLDHHFRTEFGNDDQFVQTPKKQLLNNLPTTKKIDADLTHYSLSKFALSSCSSGLRSYLLIFLFIHVFLDTCAVNALSESVG